MLAVQTMKRWHNVRRAAILGVFLHALAAPQTAEACSGPNRCERLRTLPTDGAVDVALNVELEILAASEYFTYSGRTPPTLRVAGTTELLALEPARTARRLRAIGGLAPRTTYEILGPSLDPECLGGVDGVVLATFTTGDVADTTAPSQPETTTGPCIVDANLPSTCGGYLAAIAHSTWLATDDGGLGVVYAFGSPEGPRLERGHGTWVNLIQQFGLNPVVAFDPIPWQGGPVYAIDAAGNVSEPADFGPVDLTCADGFFVCGDGGVCSRDAATPDDDAGTAVSVDGSASSIDAGSRGSGGGGCAIGGRSRVAMPALALLIASAVGARRRWRRGR